MTGAVDLRSRLDPWLAAASAGMAGLGMTLALAGGAAGRVPWVVVGGAVAAAGLAILVSAGWLEGMLLVACSVPLPAIPSVPGVRLATAAPVAAMVLAAWAWGFASRRGRLDTGMIPLPALGALVLTWVVATVLARAPLVSARELLNLAVLVGVLVAAVDVFRHRPRARGAVVTAVAVLAAACGALAVLETAGVLPGAFPRSGTSLNRAALGFGQPNGLGLFLAMSVPLVLYCRGRASGARRTAWLAALLLVAGGLVGTFSRGSWLAVLAGAGVLVFVGEGGRVLRIWLIALMLAVVADLVTGGAMRDTVARTVGDWVLEQRAALALTGLVMYLAHPVLGVGPGGFAEALEEYGALVPGLWDVQPTPHNAYIQAAAETGTVGLLALLIFTGASAWALIGLARRRRFAPSVGDDEMALRRAVLWAMATVAAAGMVIWPLAHGYGEAVVLILAVGLSAGPAGPSPKPSGPSSTSTEGSAGSRESAATSSSAAPSSSRRPRP